VGHLVRRHWHADLGAYGGRKARQSFVYDAYVPDPIANLDLVLPVDVAQVVLEAEQAISTLNEQRHAHSLEAVARQLLRSESVASSRIEGLQASQRRIAGALFAPEHADITARSILNNILAMEQAITLGDSVKTVTPDEIRSMHDTLLNTPGDARIAGVFRIAQNWIGGTENSPRGAIFVPPPEDEVPALVEDLCRFVTRDDIPPVVQAAIAHAQFETIHPFADGNGRVGRCLIHVVLRRRHPELRFVPPISVILATNTQAYIGGLTAYRAGLVAEWCATFAAAVRTSGQRALQLTNRLTAMQDAWRIQAGKPRRGSGAARLIAILPAYPIVNAATIAQAIGSSERVARLAIDPLESAGILRQISIGRRNRAWAAPELFQTINAFEWDLATPEDHAEPRRPSPTQGHRST
jgi:Fic family protein